MIVGKGRTLFAPATSRIITLGNRAVQLLGQLIPQSFR